MHPHVVHWPPRPHRHAAWAQGRTKREAQRSRARRWTKLTPRPSTPPSLRPWEATIWPPRTPKVVVEGALRLRWWHELGWRGHAKPTRTHAAKGHRATQARHGHAKLGLLLLLLLHPLLQ